MSDEDKKLAIGSTIVTLCVCLFVWGVCGGGVGAVFRTFFIVWVGLTYLLLDVRKVTRQEEQERKSLEKSAQEWANTISLLHSILEATSRAIELRKAAERAEINAMGNTR